MSEAVTSRKVALPSRKTKASGCLKLAVPKPIAGEICWHIDFGTACGTVFKPLK
jgi:hypothetical protein